MPNLHKYLLYDSILITRQYLKGASMIQFKKIIAISLFAFSLFPLSQTLAVVPAKQTMEKIVQQPESSSSDAPITTADVVKKSEYTLPFPGLLPDHPLYFLKNFRDFLLDKLIVDPIRRSEFYLLQADKKLAMAIAFIEKGNTTRAEEVLAKSGKHMEQSIGGLATLKSQGKETPGYVVDRIANALVKHEEVLNEFVQKAQGNEKENFSAVLDFVKKLQGEAGKLK